MQLSFAFKGRFELPAGVVAERILKYNQEDREAYKLATDYLKKLQALKISSEYIFKSYKLGYEFILSLSDKYYLEDK